MGFQVVTRRKSKVRMALTGVSGSGKTLGALYIAYGITGDWSKIALIDTEHERARFYANRDDLKTGAFLYQSMSAPFSPQRYKQMVKEGADAVGPDGVVIVDSFSHVWNAEGGVLDIKDKIARDPKQNSYTAWNEAGKEQSSLVNTVLAVDAHTIVTMRSKMAYELQEDDRGQKKPVKMGLAPIQRDDTEYEFDIVLDIARDHVAVASKDTTFLDKYGQVITPVLGQQLAVWLDEGAPAQKIETPEERKERRTDEYVALGKKYGMMKGQIKPVYQSLVNEGILSKTSLMDMDEHEFTDSMIAIEDRIQENLAAASGQAKEEYEQ